MKISWKIMTLGWDIGIKFVVAQHPVVLHKQTNVRQKKGQISAISTEACCVKQSRNHAVRKKMPVKTLKRDM